MNTFAFIPLPQIKPDGWIRDFLLRQRHGLTGHLEEAGYPFNTRAWQDHHLKLGDRGGTGWWPYEQTAYWIDGMLRVGILLGDGYLKRKARRQIDFVMNHPDKDGYLGPQSLKRLHGPRGSERWPHAVFFRAVLADLEDRPNRNVIRSLCRHYLSDTARHDASRNICNIEIMARLHDQTGDRRLRKVIEDSYRTFQKIESSSGATVANMLRRARSGDHGPTYMELFKLAAIMFSVTGKKRYLRAAENAQRKLERDHVLIDGVPSATEHMRGIYSTAGHETCVITDYLWSLGWLLQATGKVTYADAMERACFNALPGAVTPDFKALQYFSGPNQFIAGPQSNHHEHGTGSTHMSFRPNPATECCPGNVHRAMPAFAGRMWMRGPKGEVMAALYGPCKVEIDGMTIVEQTDYPFEPVVRFRFSMVRPAMRSLLLRIPAWCNRAGIKVNGAVFSSKANTGSWAEVHRTFRDGDIVEVMFTHRVKKVRGPEKGVAYTWGPLVFSLPIGERRRVEKSDKRSSSTFPAWSMVPSSPWNYGILPGNRSKLIVSRCSGNPWAPGSAPVRLKIEARRIPGWKMKAIKKLRIRRGEWFKELKGDLRFTPALPPDAQRKKRSRKVEELELVPLGATNLRVTWFPVIPS